MRGAYSEDFERMLMEAACGNKDAANWTAMYCLWAHFLDDIIDEADMMTAENITKSNIMMMNLCVDNWFLAHRAELFHVVQLTVALWQQSNEWAKSKDSWKQLEGEWLRCSGNLLICVVSNICGGYEAMRTITPKLLELSYKHQKQENS